MESDDVSTELRNAGLAYVAFHVWRLVLCFSKGPRLLIETLDSDHNNGHSEQPKVVVIARGLRNFAFLLCWECSLGGLFFFGWFVVFLCVTRT